jgi:peptidoglycan/LPS O-acetylase OafA/YrhL
MVTADAASRPTPRPPGSGFRHDINALRAVAVGSVLLFHFDMPGFQGGFVGVDVFFVISGFLMTQIIARGLDQGRFSLVGFYMARVRRIVPALLAMSAAVLCFGALAVDPQTFRGMARSVGSSLLFLSNFDYAAQGGYFAKAAQSNWLLHTWSLSVEWQFYLIYPLLLLALARSEVLRRHRATALAVIGVLSLALSVGVLATHSDTALGLSFYLLPSRAWEMILGGLIALAAAPPERIRTPLVIAGLVIILAAVCGIDSNTPWPGYGAIAPVAGAAMIVYAARTDAFWSRLPGVQAMGRWSYSIYLWHWPLVAAIFYFDPPHAHLIGLAGLLISVGLGAISYGLIERRLTSWLFDGRTAGDAVRILPAVAAVIAISGLIFAIPLSPDAMRSTAWLDDNTSRDRTCFLERDQSSAEWRAERCFLTNGREPVLLWGSSYAMHLASGLEREFGRSDFKIYQYTMAGCEAVLAYPGTGGDCHGFNENAFRLIKTLGIKTVILAGNWDREKISNKQIRETVERIKKTGVRVILVGQIPVFRFKNAEAIERVAAANASVPSYRPPQTAGNFNLRLQQAAGSDEFIDPMSWRCRPDGCLVYQQGMLVRDNGHLTRLGSDLTIAAIREDLSQALAGRRAKGEGAP